jgi:iron complex transport system ATP-binding protein
VSGSPLLAIDAVSVSFAEGQRPALDGISLSLPRGRLVGLLGPNGSGKSTLLRVAAGLLPPRQGAVRLDGRPLTSYRRDEIARHVATVPQQAIVPEAFTGWEVVLAGRTPHLRPLRGPSRVDEAVARRALALVDATHLADRRAGEMSGGERQRLLLARALAQEPAVLLLDEPTSHLDLPHQLAILDLTLRMVGAGDLAALAVFHDLNLAAEYCDEIALMHEGRILVHGTPREVLAPGWIARVYGVEVAVIPHPESGRPVVLLPPARTKSGSDATPFVARLPDTRPEFPAAELAAAEEAIVR